MGEKKKKSHIMLNSISVIKYKTGTILFTSLWSSFKEPVDNEYYLQWNVIQTMNL